MPIVLRQTRNSLRIEKYGRHTLCIKYDFAALIGIRLYLRSVITGRCWTSRVSPMQPSYPETYVRNTPAFLPPVADIPREATRSPETVALPQPDKQGRM